MRAPRIGFLRFYLPLSILLLLAYGPCAGVARAQPQGVPPETHILILHAHEANAPVFQETDRALARTLQSGGIPLVNQFFESLDLRRNPDPEYRRRLVEYLRVKYRHRKFDLIVTMYPEALDFVLEEGGTLFLEAPIVALYLPSEMQSPKAGRRLFRHVGVLDMLGTLEIALKLVPGAKRVYVVSGAHEIDRQQEEKARREFKKWEDRLEFHYLSQIPLEEILTTLASAPRDAVVLFLAFSSDIRGRNYTSADVVRRLSQVSTAPIFGVLEVTLGHGVVGGALFSFERTGTSAGRLVLDVLRGAPTEVNISPVLNVPAVPMFDWPQLIRSHLSVDALPPGSIVINREYTLWEQYRRQAIGAIVLLAVQALLILALLVHRQRQRKAEETLRENEERLRLALNAAALGVWSWDIPRGRIRLSEQLGRTLPATPTAEVDYKDALAIVHPEDRERIEAARQQAIRTRKEYEVEYRILQPDGTARWIVSRGSCTYDKAGAPLRMTGVSHDITERKRSELALRESEQRFRQMADAAPVLVWMSGVDKGCTYFNKRWLDFTGRTMEQERGDGWAEGVHPEDRARCLATYARAFDARQAFEAEYRLRRCDGKYRWILDIGVPRFEGDGRFAGYLGSAIDITERKKAEEALHESEERFRQVAENVADFIWEVDAEGLYRYTSPSVEKILGYRPEELVGKVHFYDLFVPEVRDELKAAAFGVFAAKQVLRALPNPNLSKDGRVVHLETSGAPVLDAVGKLLGYRGVDTDVTERRRAEEALRTSEAVSSGILASLAGHMAILDRNGGIVRVNDAWDQFARENGAPSIEGLSVGANYLEVCRRAARASEPGVQVALEGIEAVLAGMADEFALEYPCHAPGEERWFVMRVTPLKRPEGGAVISHVNITARKVAELEAERVRRDLTHATRVMMMGELTASLAHELNQPLTAIVSNAQAGERFLAGPAPPLEDVREILADVVADATRAGEVIRQIRGLVKKGAGEFVSLDLNWVIQEVVVLARTDAIVRKAAIVLELAPSLPPVRGDKTQLQQVLLNLILNGLEAMEASPADGRTLVIRTVCEDAATVRVGVQDSGPGIPPERLARIFEPFYTTKATGMGMGLSLTRSIIDAHGGRIWAENNPERGATFWFSLPVSHDPAP